MKISLFLVLILYFLSCTGSRTNELKNVVNEWDGKQILYPQNPIFTIHEESIFDYFVSKRNYAILNYIDSVGCTSCKLQLPKWKVLIGELDSITNGNVNVLFFMHPKNKKEIQYILKRDQFDYPVCIDEADSLNKLNHFPSDERFQTFLLDRDNKVLAIGNPVHNPKVKELYMKIILGDKAPETKKEIKTDVKVEHTQIDFGTFDWKMEEKRTFKLKNTGSHPLVIIDVTTSCGCTLATFPKEPIAPGKEAEIAAVYKADKPEHFNKTLTVYCNAENSPITLRVTGNAK